MIRTLVLAAAILMPPASSALAQSPAVEVRLGPAVQARARDLGGAELESERQTLAQDLQRAATQGGFRRVSVTIEDIQPTRPTPSQLGRSPSLNPVSAGLGGAAITGEAVGADGTVQPIRFRYFPDDRRFQPDISTWGDADYAFDDLARRIAAGRTPHDDHAWPPPHKAVAPTGTLIPG